MHLTHLVLLLQMFHTCRALVSMFCSLTAEIIFFKEGLVILASHSANELSVVTAAAAEVNVKETWTNKRKLGKLENNSAQTQTETFAVFVEIYNK